MLGFLFGLFVGGFFGVAIMCIMAVAGQCDKTEKNKTQENPKHEDENNSQSL